MSTSSKVVQRRGRTAPARHRGRNRIILSGVVLFGLVIIVGAILVATRTSTTEEPVVMVGSVEAVPNAEPFGRGWGPKDAPIKIEEFVDYQCPACGAYAREIEREVVATYASTGKVRYEISNFPFQGAGSRNAAEAAYCSAEQDKFWPMHTTIFLNQPKRHGSPNAFPDSQLIAIAGRLGMDTTAFQGCLTSDKYVPRVDADHQRAGDLNIQSTPTFMVNGQPYVGIQSLEDFRQILATVAPDVQLTP